VYLYVYKCSCKQSSVTDTLHDFHDIILEIKHKFYIYLQGKSTE
jgi:hypothetical protein